MKYVNSSKIGFLFLFATIALVSNSFAQGKRGDFFENELVKLILRVDTLRGNVIYDTALNNSRLEESKISDEELENNFKKEMKVIKDNKMVNVKIDRYELAKKIPCSIGKVYKVTDEYTLMNKCVYHNQHFELMMDSLAHLISKNFDNQKTHDSLVQIQTLGIESSESKLVDYQCSQTMHKQFILYSAYECKEFYLILYGLKIEQGGLEAVAQSEIVFK